MPNYLAFASDNYAGICPEALQAIIDANTGLTRSYGEDHFTDRACALIRELFESDCQIFSASSGLVLACSFVL